MDNELLKFQKWSSNCFSWESVQTELNNKFFLAFSAGKPEKRTTDASVVLFSKLNVLTACTNKHTKVQVTFTLTDKTFYHSDFVMNNIIYKKIVCQPCRGCLNYRHCSYAMALFLQFKTTYLGFILQNFCVILFCVCQFLFDI